MITTTLADALDKNELNFTSIVDTATDIIVTFDNSDAIYRVHELTYPVTVADFADRTLVFPIADLQLVLDRLEF